MASAGYADLESWEQHQNLVGRLAKGRYRCEMMLLSGAFITKVVGRENSLGIGFLQQGLHSHGIRRF